MERDKTCTFEGCNRKHCARGYCSGHYQQVKAGRQLSPITRSLPLADRFWLKVDKREPWECWGWQGATNGRYGMIGRHGTSAGEVYAHRLSYCLHHGKIPDGKVIDHICHNPRCVNPGHLQAVTQKENSENLSGPTAHSRSGIRGVVWRPDTKKWRAQVMHHGTRHIVGNFLTIEEAEAAVIAKRLELHTNNVLDRMGTP